MFLMRQRSAAKVTFPLVWTNTCCSHPLDRESELIEDHALGVRNAAQRKLLDELGIIASEDVPVDQFMPLVSCFTRHLGGMKLKELLKEADAGEEGLKLSPWIRLVVDNFLFKWWDHVERGDLKQAADMKTIHKLT
ncbi:hypothetical protein K1719_008955 [Acacia pycnantha]|nr:hypothetical protein K1719_008955 [Acacia pycnantha]